MLFVSYVMSEYGGNLFLLIWLCVCVGVLNIICLFGVLNGIVFGDKFNVIVKVLLLVSCYDVYSVLVLLLLFVFSVCVFCGW